MHKKPGKSSLIFAIRFFSIVKWSLKNSPQWDASLISKAIFSFNRHNHHSWSWIYEIRPGSESISEKKTEVKCMIKRLEILK